MNLLFLIPGLVFGLYLFSNSGNLSLVLMSALTLLVWALVAQQRSFSVSDPVILRGDRVFIGDRRLGRAPWAWPRAIRGMVYESLLAPNEGERFANLDFVAGSIGWDSSGNPVTYEPDQKAPHAILVGPTGRGKTELMRLMVTGFIGKIWVIDFKGGTGFEANPKVEIMETELTQGHQLEIMQSLFKAREVPYETNILLLVDELGEVMKSPKHAQFVESVAAKGRSLGVYLVCANQTLSMVPRTIWVNCENRFSLGADIADRTQLGFGPKSNAQVEGMGNASWLRNQMVTDLFFPFGQSPANEKAAPVVTEAANPLLSRVDPRLQLVPSEESARFH